MSQSNRPVRQSVRQSVRHPPVRVWAILVSLGCLIGGLAGGSFGVSAATSSPHGMNAMSPSSPPPRQFAAIDQPLSHKVLVAIAGLGLISLELGWFLGGKAKAPLSPTPAPRGHREATDRDAIADR